MEAAAFVLYFDMKGLFYEFGVICLGLGFCLGWLVSGCCRVGGGDVAYTDTVTVVDTIPYYYPVPRDSNIVRYVTVKLPIRTENADSSADAGRTGAENGNYLRENGNTTQENIPGNGNIALKNIPDSVEVVVPITQRVYADSMYRAYVSGYRPRLDSIFVYPRTSYITTTVKEKPKRWGIGLQAGYGYSPGNGMSPYIGIGVSYNLFSF